MDRCWRDCSVLRRAPCITSVPGECRIDGTAARCGTRCRLAWPGISAPEMARLRRRRPPFDRKFAPFRRPPRFRWEPNKWFSSSSCARWQMRCRRGRRCRFRGSGCSSCLTGLTARYRRWCRRRPISRFRTWRGGSTDRRRRYAGGSNAAASSGPIGCGAGNGGFRRRCCRPSKRRSARQHREVRQIPIRHRDGHGGRL